MRLLCWNLYNRRPTLAPALDYIAASGADILALQEASIACREALHAMGGWTVHSALDFSEAGEDCLLLVATRKPSVARRLAINQERRLSPSLIGRRAGWVECLEALLVEIAGPRPLVLANVHLSCAVGPSYRARELRQVLAALPPDRERLVCGDFNSFAHGWLRLAGPLLGFRWRDYAIDERRSLERQLGQHGLQQLAKRPATFPRLGLELDQIAVSAGLRGAARLAVDRGTFGSDHCPLLLDLGL